MMMFRFITRIIWKYKAIFTEKLNPFNISTRILAIQISTHTEENPQNNT